MPALPSPALFKLAALLGALAVLLGAFGAHGLTNLTDDPDRLRVWRLAAQYHLVHAVVLAVAALHPAEPIWAPRLLLGGIALFSGSLYAMGLTGTGWLGAITPLGGLCFIGGWLALAWGR